MSSSAIVRDVGAACGEKGTEILFSQKRRLRRKGLPAWHMDPLWLHEAIGRAASDRLLRLHGFQEGLFLLRRRKEGDFALSMVIRRIVVNHLVKIRDGKYFVNSISFGRFQNGLEGLIETLYFLHREKNWVFALRTPLTRGDAKRLMAADANFHVQVTRSSSDSAVSNETFGQAEDLASKGVLLNDTYEPITGGADGYIQLPIDPSVRARLQANSTAPECEDLYAPIRCVQGMHQPQLDENGYVLLPLDPQAKQLRAMRERRLDPRRTGEAGYFIPADPSKAGDAGYFIPADPRSGSSAGYYIPADTKHADDDDAAYFIPADIAAAEELQHTGATVCASGGSGGALSSLSRMAKWAELQSDAGYFVPGYIDPGSFKCVYKCRVLAVCSLCVCVCVCVIGSFF
jgi:hypothetical protein